MKKISLVFIVMAFVLFACHKEENKDPQNQEPTEQEDLTMQIHLYPATAQVVENAVSDVDGNTYDAVQIGSYVYNIAILGSSFFENVNFCCLILWL